MLFFISLDKNHVLQHLIYSKLILEKRLIFSTVFMQLNIVTLTLKILLEATIFCDNKQERSH